MTTRSQRDKEKKQQEEFQSILRRLLLEEDNKYCADCDAKGPRWASWNIGVFLCIRCAGIHRNLGVHISKVKSVNLDTWTEKQIMSIEGLGNRICRKVYEANLPSSFRRPQTDSALEHFIRAKYEQKKYCDKELEKQLQAKKDVPRSSSSGEVEKKKKSSQDKPVTLQKLAKAPASSGTRQSPTKTQLAPINANAFQQAQNPQPTATSSAPVTPPKTQSSMDDLLGLSTPKITDNNALFDIPISSQKVDPLLTATPQMVPSSSAPSLSSPTQQQQQQPQQPQQPVTNGVSNDLDLFGTETTNTSSGKTSKESILALFGNQPSQQQQMYNIPGGMYIPSQQPSQAQMGNNFGQPQMMMNQQQGMMGMPAGQQGMMGVNMGYGGMNAMQQQQAYLQQFQTEQVQSSPRFSQPLDANTQLSPISDMHSQKPTNNVNMHMQQPYMHMQQPADTNMLWQLQSMGMNTQQPSNMYMTQQHRVATPTSSQMNMPQYSRQQEGVQTQFMHMQQPDITQVQAQMQNMRVSGTMGMNGQVGMNGPMTMNGQIPQQPQQQQNAQVWNGGMYPSMQQAPGVPVQGNMGWGGNMAGQTLSTQLWK